jgi:pimeloyl-ACP methyl ester carboxylesterase
MTGMETVTSKDGTAIAFDEVGQGPGLILVGAGSQHQSIGERSRQFAALLGKTFITFDYDRRGRCDSTDTQPYVIERKVEDIDALITEAGGSAFLFGHSSGALLALDAAKKLVGKITKLALYEPAFVADNSRSPLPKDLLAHLEGLIDADRRDEAVAYFMSKVTGLPDSVIADVRQSSVWSQIMAVAPTLIYDATLMFEVPSKGKQQPSKRWGGITIPVLVMDGSASWAWTHATARTIAAILPNAQHRTLKGQDHGPAPEALAPVLIEFFKG